jgi:hypothetical protein
MKYIFGDTTKREFVENTLRSSPSVALDLTLETDGIASTTGGVSIYLNQS